MTDPKILDRKPSSNSTWNAGDIRATNFLIRRRTFLRGIGLLVLVSADALMICLAWTIADRVGTPIDGIHLLSSLIPILALTIVTLAASGHYGSDDRSLTIEKLCKSLTLAQFALLSAAFFYQPGIWVSRSVFIIAWLLSIILVASERFLFDLVLRQTRKQHPSLQHPVFLIGDRTGIEKVRKLLRRSQQFRVDGIIDLSVWDIEEQLDRIIDRIRSLKISEVFICSHQLVANQVVLFWHLKSAGIHLRIVHTELELPKHCSETKMIAEVPTIRFKSLPILGIDFRLKCLLDLLVSFTISILISPILLIIAIVVKLDSPGPIFYRQERVGLKGTHFKVWKFRTMVVNASELQTELEARNEVKGGVLFKIKEDPRITRVGKFLRRYSLDELPQLINVLQGEMSLVGPRPLALRDASRLSKEHFLRHEVLPGITGLWQVKGRANTDSDDVFYWDTIYILQWSLALDLNILFQTIRAVLSKEGAY
jgi:exopolysaccharide biosynthesis polyprenyl glycosylphosphotransferase